MDLEKQEIPSHIRTKRWLPRIVASLIATFCLTAIIFGIKNLEDKFTTPGNRQDLVIKTGLNNMLLLDSEETCKGWLTTELVESEQPSLTLLGATSIELFKQTISSNFQAQLNFNRSYELDNINATLNTAGQTIKIAPNTEDPSIIDVSFNEESNKPNLQFKKPELIYLSQEITGHYSLNIPDKYSSFNAHPSSNNTMDLASRYRLVEASTTSTEECKRSLSESKDDSSSSDLFENYLFQLGQKDSNL